MATPGALAAVNASGDSLLDLLMRHLTGDWEGMSEHDRRENESSVQHGWRILFFYKLSNGAGIWLITEADRSSTTLLEPEDYCLGWYLVALCDRQQFDIVLQTEARDRTARSCSGR